MRTVAASRLPFYYGWVVVAAASVLNLVTTAVLFSFGTYFESLSRAFQADRGTVSLVFAVTNLLFFGLGAITGPLADRFGPRLLVAGGALAYGVGLGLASRATELWQVYLTYSLFTALAVGATIVPAVSTVQRWFVHNRTFATGLAVAGSGAGTLVGPILSTWLISGWGWRTAYLATGLAAALLTGLAACLLRRSPTQPISAFSDASAAEAGRPRQTACAVDFTVRRAIRTSEFAGLYLAQVGMTFAMYVAIAHVVPYAQDAGLAPATAALALGAIGTGNVVSRVCLGPLADSLGRRRSFGLTMAGMAALMLGWLVLPVAFVWPLLALGFLWGVVYGQFVTLSAALMADYFGTRYVGGTIGVFYTGAGLGSLLGPWLAGWIYDSTATYWPAILLGASTAASASVAVLRLRDPAQFQAQAALAAAQEVSVARSGAGELS